MAKSSINFEKAKAHSSAHNLRIDEPDYLLPKEHQLGNEYWQNDKTAKELFDAELQKAERKGGRVPQFENSHWEGVLNLNREHKMEDVQKVAKHIEKEFNVTCTQISIHRDEGHINERGIVEYNLHAHLNFQTYKNGRQNWRLSVIKDKMPKLQTDVANILRMERGKESGYTAEQKEQIKAKVGKFSDYADKKAYNEKYAEVVKELGFESRGKPRQHIKPQAYKDFKRELETVKTLANENDLKEEVAQLRATLKEMGGKREDYAKLEALTKDLKEKVKSQIITIDDLKEQINAHKTLINDLQSKNKALDKEIATKDEKINSRANMSEFELEMIEHETKKEIEAVLDNTTSHKALYDKEGGFIPKYTEKNVYIVNDTQGFKASIMGVFNKLKEKYADLKEQFGRLTRDNDKLKFINKQALSRVEELERELKEARAELQSLKDTKVERYNAEQINEEGDMHYDRKEDGVINNERKDIKAQIAQQESKIAHIEEKLENQKEQTYEEKMEALLEKINGKKQQEKQGYNNKLNEIPKLPEEEQKPKTRKPFVRE